MRLLDRYVLRELLAPLGFCLGGFLLLWTTFDLFNELSHLQEHKLNALDMVEYALVKAPESLVFVVPIALLLALLYSLTNHARHNEITAMRSAGIALWRVCLPYLALGFLFSLGLFAANEMWAPLGTEQAERILNRYASRETMVSEGLVRGSAMANLREGRIWMATQFNPRSGQMDNPQVIWTQPDGAQLWLRAAKASRINGVWTFYDVHVNRVSIEINSMPVPAVHTNVLAMPQFSETPEQVMSEINIARGLSLGAFKRADVPLEQILDYLRLHPTPPPSLRAWLFTKLQGRLAAPWACLVVALIAIPFGSASGRRNVFVGVAGSIMICVVYIVLMQFGLALGTGGYVRPWLAAWFPNLTFGMAGCWLIARAR